MGYSPLKHKEYKICGQVDKDIFMEYLNLFKSLGGGYVKGNWQTPSFFFYPELQVWFMKWSGLSTYRLHWEVPLMHIQ